MDISTTQTYNTSLSTVTQVLLSSELAAKRAKLTCVDDYTYTVDGSKATTVVNTPAERLPSKARIFARNGAKMTITTVASGGSVTYTVDPHGLPAGVSAALKFPGDATTTTNLPATLKVRIPLLGGKIKKKATGMADHLPARNAKLVEEAIGEQGP